MKNFSTIHFHIDCKRHLPFTTPQLSPPYPHSTPNPHPHPHHISILGTITPTIQNLLQSSIHRIIQCPNVFQIK